ncbi:MAG: hypothetical protein AAF614_02195 [Chloroflexota bacterium]
MITRLRRLPQTLLASTDALQGMVMAAATLIAGGFDYAVQIVIGRLLVNEFGLFLAVTALLQVAVFATNVIRNVVAYYMADLTAQSDSLPALGHFLRQSWRWAWKWGLVATAVMALLSPWLAQLLRIDTVWPLLAGSLLLLLLFLRPVTDGALQGVQHFNGLGSVQIMQSVLRLFLAPAFIWLGWRSAGAILSLPVASAGALLLALWLLQPYFQAGEGESKNTGQAVSWDYSMLTLIGLFAFAIMSNIHPIVVQRLFTTEIANNFSPVATLGRMNLFVPLGIGLVLFPKATQRHASGQDPRPVLLLALAATLLPGLGLTAVYFLFPAQLVQLIFTDAYANPGIVLGLVGLATTLFAGVNIWLNYALSVGKRPFVYALALIVLAQTLAMFLFSPTTLALALTMTIAGVTGNVLGLLFCLNR